MAGAQPELSLTDWVVLGLVAEGASHGFGLSRELGPGGALGRIWTVRRPLVYRSVAHLLHTGLAEEAGTEDGDRGPQRRLLAATPAGRRVVRRWLEEPVAHVREVRTALLLKLALLDRSGRSPDRLLERQRAVLTPTLSGLQEQLAAADGFEAVLARWRVESAEAVGRFLDSLSG